MPTMMFFPFAPMVLMLFFVYYLIGGAFIMTADSISADDLISEVNSAATVIDETTGANVTAASSLLASSSSSQENMQFYLFWYHTLGWLWLHNSVMAVTMTSIAAGVSFWYFAGNDGRQNPENEAHKKISGLRSRHGEGVPLPL